jgi:hypothetical protein
MDSIPAVSHHELKQSRSPIFKTISISCSYWLWICGREKPRESFSAPRPYSAPKFHNRKIGNDPRSHDLREQTTGAGTVESVVGPLKNALDVQLNRVGGDGVKQEVRLLDLFQECLSCSHPFGVDGSGDRRFSIVLLVFITFVSGLDGTDGNDVFCERTPIMKPVYRLKRNGKSSLYMTIDAEVIYQTKWNDQTLLSQVFDPKTKTVTIKPLVCVDGKPQKEESKPSVPR